MQLSIAGVKQRLNPVNMVKMAVRQNNCQRYTPLQTIQDSLGFAREILQNAGVAVTPGLDFDPRRGAQTLRFSYARATADIVEGLRRLQEYMARR